MPDPDPEIRGGEVRSSRPSERGGGGQSLKNKFFGPSGFSVV